MIEEFVVDTNVAVVANGRTSDVGPRCQLTCVQALQQLVRMQRAVIDDQDLILDEYKRHLHFSGEPGTGDMFFRFLHDHHYQSAKVKQVRITPANEAQGFAELPDNGFDPSDRKFLAVAVVANAHILNATDSDWAEHQVLMDELGVTVKQLCPEHASKDS